MLHPSDELPSPVSPVVGPRWPHSVTILAYATLALIAFLGWLAFSRETTPTAVSGMSAPVTVEQVPIGASPIVFPDTLALVTHTPIATPEPTPTYAMQPTPRPPGVCLTSTPRGEVCSQPQPPLPTSTPMADCPVLPGELCVNLGGPVRWQTPTPTPDPNMTSGRSDYDG